ncbi:MAG: PhoD-like phosphatase N-terminal domain-containing protein, partial [Acidobacteria bacterium]|nr:PhoD-like phosphatase N-terminal domain-containing protein [Candidatus Sulfomarinibacter kjeldsenii]
MRARSNLLRASIPFLLICIFLTSGTATAARDDDGYPRLMQGPMVGAVTPTQVKIWARTTGEYSVSIEYATNFEMRSATTSEPVAAKKADDYVVVVELDGLEPATEYFYRILVNGEGDKYLKEYPAFRFTTAPPPGTATTFRVAFGSCPKFQDDRVQPI